MSYPKLVVIVRHSETDGNVRTRGQNLAAGIPPHAYEITQRGTAQAVLTGSYLDETFGPFDAYYVSTYPRTRKTLLATGIVRHNVPIIESSLLDEAQFGIWHFHARAEIASLYPREAERQSLTGFYHYRPFGGENWGDIEMRARLLLLELERDWPGKKVLIVGHGNWFAAFRRVVERLDIETMLSITGLNPVPNCMVAAYDGVASRWYTPWNRNRFVPRGIVVPWHAHGI